ncbi:MAG: FKBP-type peptidyl-prolyl cis-trans isomerase, partial [Phycisphaeraceae bacterium]|nr:FKBP-type peptidyl-prolyl cis-trans isomerase [Phycisphaeraceae bacterium]
MKHRKWIVTALAVLMVLAWINVFNPLSANEGRPAAPDMEKVSYVIGFQMGTNFKSQEIDLNVENFIEGMKAALGGKDSKLSREQTEEVTRVFANHMAYIERQREMAAVRKATEEFLKQDGVRRTESGLIYRIVEAGSGRTPGPRDEVVAHYTGSLLSSGQIFDSSRARGEPTRFRLDGVIPGWTEALQLLQEGGKLEVIIPPNLAYGERGAGQVIPPNATLFFEI